MADRMGTGGRTLHDDGEEKVEHEHDAQQNIAHLWIEQRQMKGVGIFR
jgi:hypothetical protein